MCVLYVCVNTYIYKYGIAASSSIASPSKETTKERPIFLQKSHARDLYFCKKATKEPNISSKQTNVLRQRALYMYLFKTDQYFDQVK